MCTLMAKHCQILMIENIWPEEFNCTNDMLYSTKVCVVSIMYYLYYVFIGFI